VTSEPPEVRPVDKPPCDPAYLPSAATEEIEVAPAFRVSRYFAIVALVWMIGMTWRIYPHFKDAVRVDGRLTTMGEYIAGACGERADAGAAACLASARATARGLLRREQGKSILLIDAPLFGYLLIYLPLRLMIGRLGRRRGSGSGTAQDLRSAG
jgi:hypothetical protein